MFPGLHLGRSLHKDHHATKPAAQLSCTIESPPIVFHGDADTSSGALVSGQLFLDVHDDAGCGLATFTATLHMRVTHKRPFTLHCAACTSQPTLLRQWTFLSHPAEPLRRGRHPFPFSVLLDGRLPATLHSALVDITYEFRADAVPARPGAAPLRLEQRLHVQRALPPPALPHHSVRVFPPTNVRASVHYPQTIHPGATNTLTLRLDGLARPCPATAPAAVESWALQKLTWRLEETLTTVAPACPKHRPRPRPDCAARAPPPPPPPAIARSATRVLGEQTLLGGWKRAPAGAAPADAHVELALDFALPHRRAPARSSCDLQAPDGTAVRHRLLLELVVAQECAPGAGAAAPHPTGVGRILRMHFGVVVTERGGIGISWDNEAPPIYQDVPPSPPAYGDDGPGAAVDGLPDHQVLERLDAVPGPRA